MPLLFNKNGFLGKSIDLKVAVKKKIKNLQDVVEFQLCCGCGACSYMYPDEIEMKDYAEQGRRPAFSDVVDQTRFSDALQICPGYMWPHQSGDSEDGVIASLWLGWGPVLEVWEGYAVDNEIRYQSSSGGVISAIALYCLEKANIDGVLQVRTDSHNPKFNETNLSTTRESIIMASGSRYSPASPCEKLSLLEECRSCGVFIGKPCDVAAVRNIARSRKELSKKIFLTIACFCAGTPSTNGTDEMLKQMGVRKQDCLKKLRYRGHGWPGKAVAEFINGKEQKTRELDYEKAWGNILQKYRQWRCHICPDRTGEFADISAGDPWYRDIDDDEKGQSLILIRTKKGQKVLKDAITSGYIKAQKVDPKLLPMSQIHLKNARARIWGQLFALKVTGTPYPVFNGFRLKKFWRQELTFSGKLRSVLGTMRRVLKRKINRRQKYS